MVQEVPKPAAGAGDRVFSPPAVSLPKGGGALRGLGEKLAAQPATGTASLRLPLPVSPGPAGFAPQLSLTYDSGAGNGPFGLGWSLGLPAITRKTDKGLPRYADGEESDVFLLSGAEDLVPVLDETRPGLWERPVPERDASGAYEIVRYRPRVEGLFARIERWTRTSDGDTFWRSLSRDDVTTFYGRTPASRIADPADPRRVFSWLICESFDDRGNVALYDYLAESAAGVDLAPAHERHRTRTAQRYLQRVRYGNTPSRLVEPDPERMDWLFEVVFDYGDEVRADPFSTYRAGFEVRTCRLCRRVLLVHRIPELGEPATLVRSTDFSYTETPILSFLTGVTQSGYVRRDDGTVLRRSLPSLELAYSRATFDSTVREVDAESLENLPIGLDGSAYRWVDLDGEGVPGILTEQAGAWFYKRNLSPAAPADAPAARFAPVETVASLPAAAGLGQGRQLLDLAGDGRLDLVQFDPPLAGFFERTDEGGWDRFQPFATLPGVSWDDPNLRFVDLTGDGHADILITGDDVFTWYPSLAEEGFGPAQEVRQALDEETGPRLVFADGEQSIHLADMSGDGLSDLVRLRNGEICYWPHLGYGRFGAKVTMDGAPWFDPPDQFNPSRIRLADVDGSGVTDVLYLGRDGVRVYFNHSGNAWSPATTLPVVPAVDRLADLQVLDLTGNGTACLVWSSPLPGAARRPLRYVDLMGGRKPHLLTRIVNHLGAETRLHYCSSTRFSVADKLAGRPWITRLPFPVHVVERVETLDRVSRNRFVTRYAYHHGFFDGIEREFRGFGMVEQWDTEELAALAAPGTDEDFPEATNLDAASHVPPVRTRTWFHTGAFPDTARISRRHEAAYWSAPEPRARGLDDTPLPTGLDPELTADELREAVRALKGTVLRQEVYADDGSPQAGLPYSVTERNATLVRLQPRGSNRHAVFFTHPRETVTWHYERDPRNPRVQHELVLAVDAFGNVLQSAAIGYGRDGSELADVADRRKQTLPLLTWTENRFTNAIAEPHAWRAPLPCETRTYELTGLASPAANGRHSFETVRDAGTAAEPIAYHAIPQEQLQKRLIEHVRTLYRRDDLSALLPLGGLEPLALPGESFKLAFTPELLAAVYRRNGEDLLPAPAEVLAGTAGDQGGYVHSEGDESWWIPSGRVFYHPDRNASAADELAEAREHFFLPRRFRDPFGQETTVGYDRHDLLAVETVDAVENRITAEPDYRVLAPRLVTDPNGNRSAVRFDALGLVAGTAVQGKVTEALGDTLDGFDPDPSPQDVAAFLADPRGDVAARLLGKASTRIVYDWHQTPAFAATLARETHASDPLPPDGLRLQVSFSYSDGFGREIQKKIQAEPGPLLEGGPDVAPRWVGSGWTIFNNKGKPVRRYEPFFSATHRFEFARLEGVSPILFYDPAERVVATLHPNHTYEKVVFDPWRQTTWDVNDTVLLDPRTDVDVGGFTARYFASQTGWQTWSAQRLDGALGPREQRAAEKAAGHHETPAIAHFDTLGRPFLTIAHNRFPRDGVPLDEHHETRVHLDIEGNQREVVDALGRVVMRYAYDMLGNRIHQNSMDAGERWMLNDVTGKPIRAWDSRGHAFRTGYDELRRPVRAFVGRTLFEKTVYGETRPDAAAKNLRGKVHQVFDGAGVATSEEHDFKGNLLRASRQLAAVAEATPDWSAGVTLEGPPYATATTYDALNRPVTRTTPDGSVLHFRYNEANLLESLRGELRGENVPFVEDVDYNAKGQRTRLLAGNQVETTFDYDPQTFRLRHLRTVRPPRFSSDGRIAQDLSYTYDPAGNITEIRDDAQQTIFFRNQRIEPSAEYTYDAVYRLIEATGREHLGQAGGPPQPHSYNDVPRVRLPHRNDRLAMGRYVEEYVYDAVGNIREMRHRGSEPPHSGWMRAYTCAAANNRLVETRVGQTVETYRHDPHGNMTTMPHLAVLAWDFEDRLQATQRQRVNADDEEGGQHHGERTLYLYDAAGQRVRKVTESATGQRLKERIYLGDFEIYREYGGGQGVDLERETLHVMDGDRRLALVETRIDRPASRLLRFQLANHLGSACLELDEEAEVISYEEYSPYGSTVYQAVRGDVEVPKRYRYTGKERDEESGLSYHGARYYAVWLGRWVAVDPAALLAGPMRESSYTGMANNPVGAIDPDGRNPISDLWADAVEGSQLIAGFIHEKSDSLGGWITEKSAGAAYRLEKAGLPKLAAGVRGAGVLSATVAATTTEVVGQTLAAGPNAVLALQSGGESIGRGAARIHTSRDSSDAILGGLEIVAGLGQGAQAALTFLPAGKPSSSKPSSAQPTASAPSAAKPPVPAPATLKPPQAKALPPPKPPARVNSAPSALDIVQRIERHVARQNRRLENAIRQKNRHFLENLELSAAQIDILLDPAKSTFAAQYGNALERATARAIRSDSQLASMVIDTRYSGGAVFPSIPGQPPLRPDFGFKSGPLQGNILDLTTPAQRAGKLEKYHDHVIVIDYQRPSFSP